MTSLDMTNTGSYRNPKERRSLNQGIIEGFPEKVALIKAEGWVGAARQGWGQERRWGEL